MWHMEMKNSISLVYFEIWRADFFQAYAMQSTFQCIINLVWAIMLAHLNYYLKLLKSCIEKLSPNFNEYNLPGFEVG